MTVRHCPHCGDTAYLQPHGQPGLENWQVICPRCQCAGPVMPVQCTAIYMWNLQVENFMVNADHYISAMECKDAD